MTDPERISKRSAGLSAQLLQAGGDEEPGAQGMQRTLAALGVSTAVVTATSTATAVAGSAKLSSAAGGASAGTVAMTSTPSQRPRRSRRNLSRHRAGPAASVSVVRAASHTSAFGPL